MFYIGIRCSDIVSGYCTKPKKKAISSYMKNYQICLFDVPNFRSYFFSVKNPQLKSEFPNKEKKEQSGFIWLSQQSLSSHFISFFFFYLASNEWNHLSKPPLIAIAVINVPGFCRPFCKTSKRWRQRWRRLTYSRRSALSPRNGSRR